MLYNLIKQILFLLDPEFSHYIALKSLELTSKITKEKTILSPAKVMGINFENPIGIAAGLDKNGDYIPPLLKLGFSFIELGTVTPRPQLGNPKPRLFRLINEKAIINKMGFNNKGIDYLINNINAVKKSRKTFYKKVIGVSIGKNANTPLENSINDYKICLNKAYLSADYIAVNISSPNTKNLRNLQNREYINKFITDIKSEQDKLSNLHSKYTPIAIKISPDLDIDDLKYLTETILSNNLDGIIATNTSTDFCTLDCKINGNLAGGISGEPIKEKSLSTLKLLKEITGKQISIISVGGIMTAIEAIERIKLGADLVQIYSSLVYYGPKILSDLKKIFDDC